MTATPTRLLLAINILAFFVLGYLAFDRTGNLRNSSCTPPSAIKASVASIGVLAESMNRFDASGAVELLDRPLFAPDRRPPPPVVAPPPPPPPDPLNSAQVLGVLSGDGGGVLIRVEGKVRFIAVAKTLGDWVLESVDQRAAKFAKGSDSKTLRLEYARISGPVSVAVAPRVAGPQATPTGTSAVPLSPAAQEELDRAEKRLQTLNDLRARMNQKKP